MVDIESSNKHKNSLRFKNSCLEILKSRQVNVVVVTFQDINSLEIEKDLFNLIKYGDNKT